MAVLAIGAVQLTVTSVEVVEAVADAFPGPAGRPETRSTVHAPARSAFFARTRKS